MCLNNSERQELQDFRDLKRFSKAFPEWRNVFDDEFSFLEVEREAEALQRTLDAITPQDEQTETDGAYRDRFNRQFCELESARLGCTIRAGEYYAAA